MSFSFIQFQFVGFFHRVVRIFFFVCDGENREKRTDTNTDKSVAAIDLSGFTLS